MARPEKVAKVEEVSADLSGAAATLLTHYRGLSVTEISELRTRLREAGAEMKVVKNTLTRRAAAQAGIDGLDELLVGPTGLILCGEDPVAPAKVLKEFAKDHPELVVRGGYFDGEILDEVATIKLADLESREDLLAKLAGLMHGALANTARLLAALPQKQAQLLQALVDAGGAPGAPTEAPADEPAADAEVASDEPATEAEADEPAAATATEADEPAAEADGETPAAEAATGEPDADGDDQA